MTNAWAEGPSRILIAGDGTLLVADQSLTDPRGLGQALAPDHPLRQAAEAMLSGGPVTAVDVLVRQLRTPRGQLAAIELRRAEATGLSLLPLRDWGYPAGGDLPAVELPDGPTGLGLSLLLPDVPAFQSGIRELLRHGRMLRDLRLMDRDAEQIRTVRLYSWLPDPSPGAAPIGVSVDVTELTEVSEDAGRFLDALLSVGPDSVLVLDVPRGELLWSNRRLARQLGYPADTLDRYAEIRKAVWWSDRPRLDEAIGQATVGPESAPRQLRLRLQDAAGRWRWMKLWLTPWLSGRADESGRPVVEQLVCTLRDVDEAVRAEQQLHWEARHDPVTGLANRRGLQDMLQRVADELDNPSRYVYFLDLDDFRRVNDALGHSAGDELLRTLAARLSMLVQPADLVARFGGDEFVVVSAVEPAVLADRMLSAVHTRTMLAGSEVSVSCSIGVATVGPAELPGDVIRRSNDAMYRAKRAGRNAYRIAGPLNSGPARERVALEADLRHAVAEASPQLCVAFQPVVDRGLRPVAAEALLRWAHPQRGTMLPSEFLDIADSAGLMSELGALILRRSMTAAADWAAAGHRLPVTVNVGARQLGSGQLERLLIELLDETGMPGEMLCLEVTESVLVDGDSAELAELVRLRELGIRIALDDFGTGYSPLTYLKRLPATVVKLDRSFVAGLGLREPGRADLAIARSVLQLGNDLGLQVIAEGVETECQLHALTELGYEFFQGFWAYSPMPAGQLGALLARPRVLGERQA
ncbi:MAG TPA: EAL domain-containing protein [Jatrophihabitans sp.]|nr:EAL domain-containing protein [Jatrophihabitans sp.]